MLVLIDEAWLKQALDLITREKEVHRLEKECEELLAKLEAFKSR